MLNVDVTCTTHHRACPCREAKMVALVKAAEEVNFAWYSTVKKAQAMSVNQLREALIQWYEGEQAKAEPCVWTFSDAIYARNYWHTACGVLFTFDRAGPKANDNIFCPKCGRRIEEREHAQG